MITTLDFAANTVIYREGERADSVYRILRGEVEIYKPCDDGDVGLAVLGPGEVFGEMGVIRSQPRIASARCHTDVVVDEFDKEDFLRTLETDPSMALPVIQMLCQRLSEMDRKFLTSHQPGGVPTIDQITGLRLKPGNPIMEKLTGARLILPNRLPFTVGRSRGRGESSNYEANDLELPDHKPLSLSRNHFSIEVKSGVLVVHDRGSLLGTTVNGTAIGVFEAQTYAPLYTGDNHIRAGGADSHFEFILNMAA